MKKLLITTLAAVSVGLCAKAEDTGFISGTSFDEEELTVGEAFNPTDTYWTLPTNTDDVFKITNVTYSADATKQHWDWTDGEKALSIDTANPILRNVNPEPGNDTTNPPQDVTTPVFFDSVVQFTATDVAPSMENTTTDKLMVWLYATPEGTEGRLFGEDEAITNLVITAGYYDGDGNRSYTNYLTNVAIQPDTWHRLTIKAINDIEILNLPTPGFEVYVDGNKNPVSGKCDYDGENPTLVTKFPSLIARNNSGVNYLQGVAFDGKGAVDDIVFTTTDPFYEPPAEVEKVNVSVSINDFDAIMMALFDGSEVITSGSASYEFEKGSTHNLQFMLNEGYELVSSSPVASNVEGLYTITVEPNSDVTIEIVVQKAGGGSGEEPEDPAKPTIGGAPVETAEAFIAAANSGVAIKVPTGWTLDGNTLKDADGNVYATFANYYTVTLETDGTVTLKLNDNAKPTINETATDADDAIVLTDTTVSLGVTNAKAGLWYGVQAYSDAACTTKLGDEPTGWKPATGETVTVTATKPEGDKAFFKVVVDDQDHTPAEEPK